MKQPTFEFVRQTPMRVTFKTKTTKRKTEAEMVAETMAEVEGASLGI